MLVVREDSAASILLRTCARFSEGMHCTFELVTGTASGSNVAVGAWGRDGPARDPRMGNVVRAGIAARTGTAAVSLGVCGMLNVDDALSPST